MFKNVMIDTNSEVSFDCALEQATPSVSIFVISPSPISPELCDYLECTISASKQIRL